MQQRRLRPGDVLDDYCPRERRVTDHAIVAMIDDTIQQTRCVVCDAEHEYKQAKVPAQRRKKTPALFTQVLDGLKAPARPPQVIDIPEPQPALIDESSSETVAMDDDTNAYSEPSVAAVAAEPVVDAVPVSDHEVNHLESTTDEMQPEQSEGPFRRRLIRAALPRPEGVTPPTRVIPDFTIRQPMGRSNRHVAGGGGGRRRGHGQGQGQGQNGPMRFGRGAHGRFNGNGRSGGHGGHGGPNGNRAGGSRRGGKKR